MKAREKSVSKSALNRRKTAAKLDITDPADIVRYRLCLSEDDLREIRAFEEGLIAAEQELGTVRFG